MGIAYVGGALIGALGNFMNPWLVSFLPYTRALQISGCRPAARVAGSDLRAARPARGCRTDPRRSACGSRRGADSAAALCHIARAAVFLAAPRWQRGVHWIDCNRQLPDEVRARRTGLCRSGRAQSNLGHRFVHSALRRDRGASARGSPCRSLAAATAHAGHLRARGGCDSDALSRASIAAWRWSTRSPSSSDLPWAPTTC